MHRVSLLLWLEQWSLSPLPGARPHCYLTVEDKNVGLLGRGQPLVRFNGRTRITLDRSKGCWLIWIQRSCWRNVAGSFEFTPWKEFVPFPYEFAKGQKVAKYLLNTRDTREPSVGLFFYLMVISLLSVDLRVLQIFIVLNIVLGAVGTYPSICDRQRSHWACVLWRSQGFTLMANQTRF